MFAYNQRKTRLAVALVVTVLASVSTQASIIQTNTTGAVIPAVSATDLVNQGQSTLSSTNTNYVRINSTYGLVGVMNDGAALSTASASVAWETNPWYLTFNLDLTTNTAGYDITRITTFSGYSYADQKYELLYSTVDAPATFISLGTYTYVTGFTSGVHFTAISLTDGTGTIVSNVAAIRFNFTKPGAGTWNPNYTAWFDEVDVIGIPSIVPEPASLALLCIGIVMLAWKHRDFVSRHHL